MTSVRDQLRHVGYNHWQVAARYIGVAREIHGPETPYHGVGIPPVPETLSNYLDVCGKFIVSHCF